MGEFLDGELSQDPGTLKHHPALVLNADYRPLSYYSLSLWCWQDAVKAAYMERVDIVAQYDKFVHSPTTCLLYTSPSPRDRQKSRMPSSA